MDWSGPAVHRPSGVHAIAARRADGDTADIRIDRLFVTALPQQRQDIQLGPPLGMPSGRRRRKGRFGVLPIGTAEWPLLRVHATPHDG